MTTDERYAIAPDGLLARRNGRYAEDKLQFLNDYLPPALLTTKNMHRRHVIDLFAGPGWNVDKKDPRYDFPGSPFRELAARPRGHPSWGFSDAHLVNLDEVDQRLLEQRVDRWCAEGHSAVPRDRIRLVPERAASALPRILAAIPPLDYIFVFADIEGVEEFPWSMVEELRAHRHKSLELYMLFPLQMTLQRLMSYDTEQLKRYEPVITAFFGTEEWLRLYQARTTDALGPEFRQGLVDLYVTRLRALWPETEEQVNVKLTGSRDFYRMIFASRHPVGGNIAQWQRDSRRKQQLRLGL